MVVDLWPRKGDPRGLAMEAGKILTGWNYETASWDFGAMKWGTIPIIVGLLVHKLVGNKLGVNRALGQAGVPWIRL